MSRVAQVPDTTTREATDMGTQTLVDSAVAGRSDHVASPRPAQRIKHGATVLADVPDEPADGIASATNDAERMAELRRFLEAGLPAAQTFVIRPNRDTLVTGPQGTQLLVPANAWALSDSSATVQLTLREFYTATDMVLAGLSTTSGPELLETGGMLHLTATANGRPVALRPGAFVHLRLPAKEKKPGMRLFEGVMSGPGQAVDWRLPQPPVPPADSVLRLAASASGTAWRAATMRRPQGRQLRRRRVRDATHASWPDYEGGDKQLRKDLEVQIGYAEATRARLRRTRRITRAEKAVLIEASKQTGQRILRVVQARLVLDTTGVVGRTQTETSDATTDKQLNKDVLAAIAQLGGWNAPAVQREYPSTRMHRLVAVEAARHFTIFFPETGPVVIKMGKWINETQRLAKLSEEQTRLIAVQKQHAADSLYRANKPYFDSLARVRAAAELVRLRTQFTDTSRAAISEKGVYNELSSLKLEWINCDAFVRSQKLASNRTVYYQVARPKGAVVKLFFKEWRSIVSDDYSSQEAAAVFHSAPLKQPVTVVALRRENGVTYLALQEASITEKPLENLHFHPVTMAELRAELAQLD
ncbi:hypothetical protein [Hymenobacter convexus]|uniref:hypothetical protein n=1 Tax=Hymenobacter sp. CA1UV-4 TaxID=3063782 RepID=UPI00272989A2|nr:hypothetical protein [Hymenobacter sp. CA1UV-4]